MRAISRLGQEHDEILKENGFCAALSAVRIMFLWHVAAAEAPPSSHLAPCSWSACSNPSAVFYQYFSECFPCPFFAIQLASIITFYQAEFFATLGDSQF
jgi:hypothetical protein